MLLEGSCLLGYGAVAIGKFVMWNWISVSWTRSRLRNCYTVNTELVIFSYFHKVSHPSRIECLSTSAGKEEMTA